MYTKVRVKNLNIKIFPSFLAMKMRWAVKTRMPKNRQIYPMMRHIQRMQEFGMSNIAYYDPILLYFL
jgi:hypothetical protein